MFRTQTLFSRTFSNIAHHRRILVCDVATTVSPFRKLIDEQSLKVFRNHFSRIQKTDLPPNVGMNVEQIEQFLKNYPAWIRPYKPEARLGIDITPFLKRDAQQIHAEIEARVLKQAHQIQLIGEKASILHQLFIRHHHEGRLDLVLNTEYTAKVMQKLMSRYQSANIVPSVVLTANDGVNGEYQPEMLEKLMQHPKIQFKNPAKMVVVTDNMKSILATKTLAVHHESSAWSALDLSQVESSGQKEKISKEITELHPSHLRPNFILHTAASLLEMDDIVTRNLKKGISPADCETMVLNTLKERAMESIGFRKVC
jgi:hypothetical protein